MKKLITLLVIAMFAVVVMGGQLYKRQAVRVYDEAISWDDSTNGYGKNLFLDSSLVDSIYISLKNYDVDGYISLTFVQLDSLGAGTELDSLIFKVQSVSDAPEITAGNGRSWSVQGDVFTLDSDVNLNYQPHNSKTYNITQAYALNADEADETMLNWLCIICQNLGGVEADSAHIAIFLEAR